MKKAALSLLAPAVLLATWAMPQRAAAQAQAPAEGPGSYVSVGATVSVFQADYGKRYIGGATVYTDIHPTWRYGIEGEARYLRYHTDQDVTETNYLVGPRISLRPGPWRPYVKVMAGAGHIVLPFHYAEGTFFTVAPGGGVEYLLGDRLSVRLVDFEYQMWHDFPYGQLRPYGISAGINFRINGLRRVPRTSRTARW